jgi:hypothetical protein
MWSFEERGERGWRMAIGWLQVLAGSKSYMTNSFIISVLKPCGLFRCNDLKPKFQQDVFLLTLKVKGI